MDAWRWEGRIRAWNRPRIRMWVVACFRLFSGVIESCGSPNMSDARHGTNAAAARKRWNPGDMENMCVGCNDSQTLMCYLFFPPCDALQSTDLFIYLFGLFCLTSSFFRGLVNSHFHFHIEGLENESPSGSDWAMLSPHCNVGNTLARSRAEAIQGLY